MKILDDFKDFLRGEDVDDEDFEEFSPRNARESAVQEEKSYAPPAENKRNNKVVSINATTQLSVVLVKPEQFENAVEIADHLKAKRTGCSTWSRPIRILPGGWWTFSVVWPMPMRVRLKRSPTAPISLHRIMSICSAICWTSWRTTGCTCNRMTQEKELATVCFMPFDLWPFLWSGCWKC